MKKQNKMKDNEGMNQGMMRRESIEVSANQLRSAPWNPREKITAESVADLTASIKTVGLIEPLVVMKDPDKASHRGQDFYVIIAGHRRYAAWVAAGMGGLIRCEVVDCDVETAKRMTMIENLQRKDVDPLMEANLVEGLVQGGMTIEAIAAETGRGEKWVWRRKQLSKLTSGWRKLMGKIKGKFTVDCLEKIARYDAKVQDAVFEEAKDNWRIQQEPKIEWGDIRHYFTTRSMELSEARFCTKDCEHCAYNTATTPMLFDELEDKGKKGRKLGTCMNKTCYDKKATEWFEAEKAKLEKQYGKLKSVKFIYSISYNYSDKKDKTRTVPIIENGSERKRILWIEQKAAEQAEKRKQAQEKAKSEKSAADARVDLEDGICVKIEQWCKENLKEKLRNLLFSLDPDKRCVLAGFIYDTIVDELGEYRALAVGAILCKTLIGDGVELSEEEREALDREYNIHSEYMTNVGSGGEED